MSTPAAPGSTFLAPTFKRAALIWWACFWRSLLLGIGSSMFVALILSIGLNGASETVLRYASLILGGIAGVPMGIWAFQMVLEKKFREFTICLVPNAPKAVAETIETPGAPD